MVWLCSGRRCDKVYINGHTGAISIGDLGLAVLVPKRFSPGAPPCRGGGLRVCWNPRQREQRRPDSGRRQRGEFELAAALAQASVLWTMQLEGSLRAQLSRQGKESSIASSLVCVNTELEAGG